MEPRVTISPDGMEAYLYLPMPNEITVEYEIPELMNVLMRNQVVSGIDQEALLRMVKGHVYLKDTKIASGRQPVNGKDGSYKMLYKKNEDTSEELKKNNNGEEFDYWNYNTIDIVERGQVILSYEPATQGINGVDVRGRVIPAKRARDLPPYRGTGFVRTPDNRNYIASENGRIDIIRDRIMIHPIALFDENYSKRTEQTSYKGDVFIHGNVESGSEIVTTGSVIIDGVVEGAKINAGGDVIIRGGITGNGTAVINAKGRLVSRFIEYCTVYVEGSINTDVIMESQVYAMGKINVTSGRGTILGGSVHSVTGIEASVIGNEVDLTTKIRIGVDPVDLAKIKRINMECADYEKDINSAEEVLKAYQVKEMLDGVSYKDNPQRLEALRTKIQNTSKLSLAQAELKIQMDKVEKGNAARVMANDMLYGGTVIMCEEEQMTISSEKKHVFAKKMGKTLRIQVIDD